MVVCTRNCDPNYCEPAEAVHGQLPRQPCPSWPRPLLQDEITELRRRLALVTHQADQLRGEISARDSTLQKEKYDHAKVGAACAGGS